MAKRSWSERISSVLTGILTLYFLLAGICKVTSLLHPDTYHFMFEKFRLQIAPAWAELEHRFFQDNFVFVDANYLRISVGLIEIVGSTFLHSKRTGNLGALLLAAAMGWGIMTNIITEEDPVFPVVIFCLCLLKWYLLRAKPLVVVVSSTPASTLSASASAAPNSVNSSIVIKKSQKVE